MTELSSEAFDKLIENPVVLHHTDGSVIRVDRAFKVYRNEQLLGVIVETPTRQTVKFIVKTYGLSTRLEDLQVGNERYDATMPKLIEHVRLRELVERTLDALENHGQQLLEPERAKEKARQARLQSELDKL